MKIQYVQILHVLLDYNGQGKIKWDTRAQIKKGPQKFENPLEAFGYCCAVSDLIAITHAVEDEVF